MSNGDVDGWVYVLLRCTTSDDTKKGIGMSEWIYATSVRSDEGCLSGNVNEVEVYAYYYY